MRRVRLSAAVAVVGPLVAAVVSLAVGRLNPGYDPVRSSVSRLAEVGAPGALVMDAAIALLGLSLIALALAMRWTPGRSVPAAVFLVGIAGLAFVAGSLVRIDPAAQLTVLGHRAATGTALVCLVFASLVASRARPGQTTGARYRQASLAFGVLAAAGLIGAVGLLFDGFPGGVWERAMAVLTLGWAELSAVRLLRPAREA
jgi:hypothetical membrane protein